MRILVSEIPEQGMGVAITDVSLDVEALKGLVFKTPPDGGAFVEKAGRDVIIRGHFSAVLGLECSRCVEPVAFSLDVDFRHTLRPRDRQDLPSKEVELHDEDFEFGYYEDDLVELNRIVEEHIVLAVPIKPLCGEGCKGLCARCGKNLNEADCGCRKTEPASPFEKLKDFVLQNQ